MLGTCVCHLSLGKGLLASLVCVAIGVGGHVVGSAGGGANVCGGLGVGADVGAGVRETCCRAVRPDVLMSRHVRTERCRAFIARSFV
jgi:hypothetical protein